MTQPGEGLPARSGEAWNRTGCEPFTASDVASSIGDCPSDGEGQNRTGDTTIFSRVLYQLSYLARRRMVATHLGSRALHSRAA